MKTSRMKSALFQLALSVAWMPLAAAQESALGVIPVTQAAPDKVPESGDGKVASKSRLVEEIIVTAQKREENLQDVPVSVAAFSGEALDARGIIEPKDLQRITPGLNMSEQAGFAVTFLRGVGTDAYLMADPSVNLYIDGVYFPFAHGLGQALGAVERIEVEKGPQGTLFGRNAIGGAINVITKDPGGTQETSMQLSYGRYDQRQTRIYTNVPLTDTLAVSLAGLYNSEDSYYTGTVNAGTQALPREMEKGARVKIKWRPFDNTDLIAAAFVVRQQGERTMFAPNDKVFPLFRGVIQPQTTYNASVDAPAYFTQSARVYYGQMRSEFEWVDVKALVSRQYAQTPSAYDFDGSPTPLATFYAANLYGSSDSAELQVSSNASSWGADWLKWIGGFYYFKGKQGFDPNYLNVAGTDLSNSLLLGINLNTLPGGLASQVLNIVNGLPLPIPTGQVRLEGVLGTKSYAGYAQSTINFNEYVALSLAARFTHETRTILKSNSQVETTTGSTQLFDWDTGQQATLNKLSPKVSLETHPFGDETLAYLSWQEASKSGTYNVINIYQPAQYVPPETIKAWELGYKTQLFDGAVRLNAAAFYYQDTNLQVQVISLLNGGAVSFESAKGAHIKGVDFDAVAQLFPEHIDGLVLTASAAYLKTEYTSYTNGSGFDPTTGLFRHAAYDFTGHPIAHTPDYSGNLGLSKTFTFDNGSLEVGGDVYVSGKFWFFPQDTDYSLQPAYHQINAQVSYLHDPWHMRFTVFGTNLNNAEYSVGQFLADFGRLNYKSRPASAGLRINWDF